MRYFRIFLLHFQDVFEQRGRSLVWLLLTFVGPLVMILFWRGASAIPDWSMQQITSYYFLIIILGAFIMTHIEEEIGRKDIHEGQLTMFLLKPFSYIGMKFFYALPNRLIQGIFGVLFFLILFLLFPNMFSLTESPLLLLLGVFVVVGGFFIAFLFKMIVGLFAFWMTEARGLFDVINAFLMIFAGYLMPLSLFPSWLANVTYLLPFSYMLYFPVLAFEGKLKIEELLHVLGMQALWIGLLFFLYKIVWNAGIKKYSAVGQ